MWTCRNSIKKLQEKYADKIVIETGYEVEYVPGEEENIKELKEETNKIVLGQHFIYKDDSKTEILRQDEFTTDKHLIQYAENIEKALELGIPDIIAHPDFFMRRENKEFGKIESEVANRICKVAEKYQIPLEINLNNIFNKTYFENEEQNHKTIEEQKEKLGEVAYPCKEFWKIATNYKVKVLYGMDVHHRGKILLWNKLRQLANELLGKEIIKKLNFIEEL